MPGTHHALTELVFCGGFGLLTGIWYDLFRIVRMLARPSRAVVFVMDVLCWFLAGIATFYFLLALNNCVLRWYLFVAMAAGFLSWRATGGRLITRFTRRIARLIGAAVRTICAVAGRIGAVLALPFRWLGRRVRRLGRFFQKFTKNLLPKRGHLLYNYKKSIHPSDSEVTAREGRQ